jgi:hypothetical protein
LWQKHQNCPAVRLMGKPRNWHLRRLRKLFAYGSIQPLSTADDDDFLAIHDLYMIVWVHHLKVSAVEPSNPKSLISGFRVYVITEHHLVAA